MRDSEDAAARPRDDQAALAQYCHGVPDSLVGNAVLRSDVSFRRQAAGELAGLDPRGNGRRHLHVGMTRAVV